MPKALGDFVNALVNATTLSVAEALDQALETYQSQADVYVDMVEQALHDKIAEFKNAAEEYEPVDWDQSDWTSLMAEGEAAAVDENSHAFGYAALAVGVAATAAYMARKNCKKDDNFERV